MTALPEQDQPPLRSLLQPAGPVGSQAWEIWRDLLSKIQTDRPRMGAEGKGRGPYANREELLLQSSFSAMP